ncbi:MAG: hypothetical protein HY556_07730 [Euryarchaeota archaeon]|nr:hypothetical protein [Euryarchaeota archaeon]
MKKPVTPKTPESALFTRWLRFSPSRKTARNIMPTTEARSGSSSIWNAIQGWTPP